MLAGLSVFVAIFAAAPWWMPPWMLFIASGALAKGMVALGLMLLLRGGLVSFGHALYFGHGIEKNCSSSRVYLISAAKKCI
jgi:branched-chain amino acid transport system permease protein